jgi:hypothetical protein
MLELKRISRDTLSGALAKAERYRLLNEPEEAESICRDVLAVAPANQQAIVSLTLALTDQIGHNSEAFSKALEAIEWLEGPYERAYYAGIAWERRAKARHMAAGQGAQHYVYEWILKAMDLFEQAEPLRPPNNDDALLRWNACVRYLWGHKDVSAGTDDVRAAVISE